MAKKQTVGEIILESFQGSRYSRSFNHFTDDEYIGYVTAVVKLQNLNRDFSVVEALEETRRLLKDGSLD